MVSQHPIYRLSNKKIVFTFSIYLIHILIVQTAFCQSVDSEDPTVEIRSGWQYRWGTSPQHDAEIPIHTLDDTTSTAWIPVKYNRGIGIPPNKTEENELWLRVHLSKGN